MTWTKLDDSFYDCPKVVKAGNEAAGVYARALSYCGKHNTNGRLPKEIGEMLAGKKVVATRLIDFGLWEIDGSEFVIPDYLEFNPSRDQVAGERQRARERMASVRANKNGTRSKVR